MTFRSGLFQHDIIRHYVISTYAADELRALQQLVVDELLAARPRDGFSTFYDCVPNSAASYTVSSIWWHIRGATETPADGLLCHSDLPILENVAIAFGEAALTALAEQKEEGGDLVGAAHCHWVAGTLASRGSMAVKEAVGHKYRAAEILQKASPDGPHSNEADAAFELHVLRGGKASD